MPAGSNYWVKEGMLAREIYNADLNGDGVGDFIHFGITNKFLHPNHPLGWMKNISVQIDGEIMDRDAIYFVIRGQWIPLRCMVTIRDIWWHTLEKAEIYVKRAALLPGTHLVKCTIDMSLHVHTENLDPDNIFPCLQCKLKEEMKLCEEVSA